MKTYELPMSRDYVRHWGLQEAVRELLQNAIDSESPFEYSFAVDQLTITSRYSELDPRTLVLGTTSKADQADKIGSFGEGYKIALLVLARLGKPTMVLTGGKAWTPGFRHSEQFGAEVFCIDEEDNEYADDGDSMGVQFCISGLSDDEQDAIRANCLRMQPLMTDVIGAKQGHILPSQPGKLYIGGLFVCKTKLQFGYDVLPEHLALERDRKTVDGFDLKWLTKEMWFTTGRWEQMAELIEQGIPDMEHAECGAPAGLRDACYELFEEKSPGAIAIKSQIELDRLNSMGHQRTAFVGSAYHSLVTSSLSYRSTRAAVIKQRTPGELLDEWFKANRKYLRRLPLVRFKALLVEAKEWRLS